MLNLPVTPRLHTRFGSVRFAVWALALGALALIPLASKTSAAQSDSERLEKLERAVELLQQRNAELEREVSSLKKQKSSATVLSPEKRSKFVPDSKSYVEKTETVEEKKPLYVVQGGPEIKLVLGGFIHMQYEAGDVFAFEGRFGSAIPGRISATPVPPSGRPISTKSFYACRSYTNPNAYEHDQRRIRSS